jgi:hypothetical protein
VTDQGEARLRILACRIEPNWGASASPAVHYYPGDRDDELAHLTALIAPVLRSGDTIIAIVPDRDGSELEDRLLAVRSALDSERLVVHRTSLPPLAAVALVRALDGIAATGGLPAGIVASAVTLVESSIVPVAWLRSVTHLQRPNPAMGQHLRSFLPGAGFLAQFTPEERVLTAPGSSAELPLPDLPVREGVVGLVASGSEELPTPETSAAWRTPGLEVARVPLPAESPRWWGTTRLVEAALAPTTVRLVLRIRSQPVVECGWCGERIVGPVCPLCRAAVAASDDPAQHLDGPLRVAPAAPPGG